MNTPSITVTVPILNEVGRIGRLLQSIAKQSYPSEKLEVLIVDGGSTDGSLEICETFGCTIVQNPDRDAEVGKKIGCANASGDLHMYMDADMEWADDDALSNLVRPWLEIPDLAGSFPSYAVHAGDPAFNRYMSSHPLYQDPLMRFISTGVADTIVSSHDGYELCLFAPGRVPVVGVILYPTAFVRAVITAETHSRWIDGDFAIEVATRELGTVAYVPTARIYHRSALSRRTYLRKLRRNIRTVYLPTIGNRRSTYASWESPTDLGRLAVWFLYANTILPPIGVALHKAVRHRDIAMLYDAWATTVGTDYVAAQFLADPRGRALAKNAASSLLRGLDWRFMQIRAARA